MNCAIGSSSNRGLSENARLLYLRAFEANRELTDRAVVFGNESINADKLDVSEISPSVAMQSDPAFECQSGEVTSAKMVELLNGNHKLVLSDPNPLS